MSTDAEPDYELVDRVRARLAAGDVFASDVEALLEYVDLLEGENEILIAEVERLSPPEPSAEPHPMVVRAMAKFHAKLAEVRAQEDDGEPS